MKHADRCAFDLEDSDSLAPLVPGAVTVLTLTVAFGLLAAGFEFFWVTFIVGFGVVMPIAVGLAKRAETDRERGRDGTAESGQADALDDLRRRYARGELTDAEFERRLERLLETESVADARAAVGDSQRPVGQRRVD